MSETKPKWEYFPQHVMDIMEDVEERLGTNYPMLTIYGNYCKMVEKQDEEIARLRALLKKVEAFYSDLTTDKFLKAADHDLLEEVRAELGETK